MVATIEKGGKFGGVKQRIEIEERCSVKAEQHRS